MASFCRARQVAVAGLMVFTAFQAANAYHAFVDSFFQSSDTFVQHQVIPNIEKYRKADVVLQFRAANGSALTGLQVQAHMIKHSFLFGCCLLSSDTDRRAAPWLDLFNFGLPEGAGKWDAMERSDGVEDFTAMDNTVNWAERHGVTVEEHFLSGYVPSWAQALSGDAFGNRQLLHMRHVIQRYGNRIRFYQVDNEAKLFNISHWDSLKASFPQYKDRFGICNSINDIRTGGWSKGPWDFVNGNWTAWYMPGASEVAACWPGITFAANQVHCGGNPGCDGTWYSPQQFYEGMFNKYLNSNIEVQVTELDLPVCDIGTIYGYKGNIGHGTQNFKAMYYVQAVAVCFSHPAVEALNFWGFGPNTYMTGAGFIDANYNPLPCYDALKSLIKDKFWTKSSGTTDAQGNYTYRGFQGYYEVVATGPNGLSIRDTFELKPSQTPVIIPISSQGVTANVPRFNVASARQDRAALYTIRGQLVKSSNATPPGNSRYPSGAHGVFVNVSRKGQTGKATVLLRLP